MGPSLKGNVGVFDSDFSIASPRRDLAAGLDPPTCSSVPTRLHYSQSLDVVKA